VRLASAPRRVGSDGVKLALKADAGTLDAIGWGMESHYSSLHISRPVDVAFRLEREEYRGVSRLQLKLADLRP
ncbi:MAG: single-stranded-DNA-specific exonuclease RecJ, partial [Gemmatimonas sp.]